MDVDHASSIDVHRAAYITRTRAREILETRLEGVSTVELIIGVPIDQLQIARSYSEMSLFLDRFFFDAHLSLVLEASTVNLSLN